MLDRYTNGGKMAPVVGIEPTLRVLETLALPLYYTDIIITHNVFYILPAV
jgi:hypothetical protein